MSGRNLVAIADLSSARGSLAMASCESGLASHIASGTSPLGLQLIKEFGGTATCDPLDLDDGGESSGESP